MEGSAVWPPDFLVNSSVPIAGSGLHNFENLNSVELTRRNLGSGRRRWTTSATSAPSWLLIPLDCLSSAIVRIARPEIMMLVGESTTTTATSAWAASRGLLLFFDELSTSLLDIGMLLLLSRDP